MFFVDSFHFCVKKNESRFQNNVAISNIFKFIPAYSTIREVEISYMTIPQRLKTCSILTKCHWEVSLDIILV